MSDDPEMKLLFHLAWAAAFDGIQYGPGLKTAPASEGYALERAKEFLVAYKERHPEVLTERERRLRDA